MKNVIVHKSETLKSTLKKIGKNTLGSCIVVENKDKLFEFSLMVTLEG